MRLSSVRRGDGGFSWIAVGVLACAFLLIGIVLTRQIGPKLEESPREARCRESILIHSKLLDLTADTYGSAIECEPRRVEVKTGDPQAAQRQIAEAMRSCYDRWGGGDMVLFNESGIYCNPCAYLVFDRRDAVIDIGEFLTSERVPDSDLTYADYFLERRSSDPSKVDRIGSEKISIPIATQQDGVVLFIYAKGASAQAVKEYFGKDPVRSVKVIGESAAIGTVVGAATGAIVGGLITFASGGSLAPSWPVLIKLGAVAGTGTAVGGISGYFKGEIDKPEWVSRIIVMPNDPAEISRLGCRFAEQEKPGSAIRDV